MNLNPSMTTVYIPHVGWLDYFENDDVVNFLREGWFEYKELAFLWLYLRDGDIFIDGGGHAGLFSVAAGQILKGTGYIFAIEPAAETATLLRGNLNKNNIFNAAVLELAISHKNGKVLFNQFPNEKSAYASLYVTGNNTEQIEIEAITLDSVLEKCNIKRVDFLKLDIEGAEIDALSGGAGSIKEEKLPLIMVEFTENNLQASGNSTFDLYSILKELGYKLYYFNEDSLQLDEYNYKGPIWYENLFACLDVDFINHRLKESSEERLRISRELILKGKRAGALKNALEELKLSDNENQKTITENQKIISDQVKLIESDNKLIKELREESQERLSLLRRSYIQHQLAERRIDNELLCRWPLQLAFKSRLLKPPVWVSTRKSVQKVDDPVAKYIAEHPIGQMPSAEQGEMSQSSVRVSVILCTYNPNPELLEWALESIARQDANADLYEVILVDNNSSPAINLDHYPISKSQTIKIIREKKQGLIYARLAGIKESIGKLIIFVDDDNYLSPNYINELLTISANEPEVGLFGGISHGRLECKVPGWKQKLLPYLGVRNDGPEPITSFEPHWGPWEPIGAGMVSRRDVAEAYVNFVENNPASGGLGRQGTALLSCEDSLFARVANSLGYACSYQPSLHLEHYISKNRLSNKYLFRLLRGLGRSYVRLEYVLGRGNEIKPATYKEMISRFIYKFSSGGIVGLFQWAWDLGYFEEVSQQLDAPKNITRTK